MKHREPRPEPLAFTLGKEKMACSGGFWASLSPIYQLGKKQTLKNLACGGWVSSLIRKVCCSSTRQSGQDPVEADLSHKAVPYTCRQVSVAEGEVLASGC